MKSSSQSHKDPIFVLGGMIVLLTIVVGTGFLFLYYKSELDVKQVGNEVGIVRSILTEKSRLDNRMSASRGQIATEDPVLFRLGSLDASVSRTESLGYDVKLDELRGAGEECGHPQTDEHYRELIRKLKSARVIQYDITSNLPSQDPRFTFFAVENVIPEYRTINDVKQDLDVCAAGGIYPHSVNAQWIVFTGSCGGATDADLPESRCGEIRDAVEPTLTLKK